ncbi:Histidine-trna ligase, partial [Globisporangium splendens]
MSSASRVTIGSGKLSIADISAVAALHAKVHVDVPAAQPEFVHQMSAVGEARTEAVTAAINAQIDDVLAKVNEGAEAHSVTVSRAILVVQLHRLLRLRATPAVIESAEFAANLLNADVTPHFVAGPVDTTALSLLSFLQGKGVARRGGAAVAVDAALKDAGISLPASLSIAEKEDFLEGPTVLLAVNVLAVAGARGLLPLADAVAALTCETIRANSAPFEAEYVDASRPHRGIVTSATNLRLMLENSKFVNSRQEFEIDPECVRYVPQYHGPVRDAVLAAYKTVELELNSAIVDGIASKRIGTLHPQVLKTALGSTLDGLQVLLKGTNERRQVIDGSLSPLAVGSACAIDHVQTVAASLAGELELSLKFFESEDELIKVRLAEKNAKAQEAAAKAAAAAAKEDEKLAAMSEAQRAKILEKRKKKLEKSKEKDGAKKGGKEEVKIGAGSTAFRQFVTAQSGVPLASILNPFDLRPTGAASFVEDLLVRIGSGGSRRKPKIAKGAQDFLPHQMQLREKIFNKIRMVFKRHAGVEIETPVFELKETLTGKYGEDSKLIYDLADQGGELLALRYDLTVPFARFMALHNPGNIKRYHIARVYRRDNPQMARGRFREFYQCDFDIAGSYAPMLPDAEVLSIGIEVLQQFPELGPVKVKLSHRLLLDAILAICGVPADKFRTTCSAIDKLDKEPWANVRREMVDDKGIPEDVADRIQQFVCKVGSPRELHAELTREKLFGDNADANKAMGELQLLFEYLDAMGVLEYVSFDLSLARGLDYYTGLIYEFVLMSPEHNVGSIAAGGRYDNLVGMFSATGQQIPCVGVSMGIERIFGILQAHAEKTSKASTPPSQVLVASTGGSLLLPKLAICKELWRANISAEVMQVDNPKFTKQLHYALESGIPYMVVIGEDELASGQVKIKEIAAKDEVAVPRADMVTELLRRNCPTTNTLNI